MALVPAEKNFPGDQPRQAQRTQQNHGFQGPAGGEDHRGQAQNGTDHVEDGHRLLLVKAHVNQPVMHMTAVRRHGALALGQPPQDSKAGVKQRQAQHQEGHRKGNDGVKLE